MTEPRNRAQAADAYLRSLGVRARPAPRRSAPLYDDDDIRIGEARMLPPDDGDIDVDIGEARIEDETLGSSSRETVVPEIRIEGDPGRESPRLGNIVASLPEFLSEPLSHAIGDDESMIGEVYRRGAEFADTHDLPDVLAPENMDRLEAAGRAGFYALPFGLGRDLERAPMPREMRERTQHPRAQERGFAPARPEYELEALRQQQLRAEHPIADAVGTVGGSLPSALVTPAPTAPTALGRIGQAARNNALVGGVSGYGLSDEESMLGRARDAGIGTVLGGTLGGTGQALGEAAGAGLRLWRARNNPAPLLEGLGDLAERGAQLSDGPAEADAVRRLTRAADELQPTNVGTAPDDEGWIGAARTRDDVPPFRWTDDMPEPSVNSDTPYDANDTLEAQLRRHNAAQESTAPRPRARGRVRAEDATDFDATRDVTEVDVTPDVTRDVTEVDAAQVVDDATQPNALDDVAAAVTEDTDDVADEFLGAVAPRPQRMPPVMPSQGPALREAALRGERSFGARGDAAADPSIAFTDELSAMARDYADIEGGVGGFQPLKERRIVETMASNPPPAEWAPRAQRAIAETRARLEQITRNAGADSRLARNASEARFALDEAERLFQANGAFGAALDPADVYRQLNRANMSIGRAAAAEARQSGMGTQHTTAFAEPLTRSYQALRSFLMDEGSWGAAARVQREMNASTAPLLRSGRALREQVGTLFQDSGEQAAQGGGFRTYETVRPEAVRGVLGRVGDDAYEGERQLLRAWIENYGEQGATLARVAQDPALAPAAQQMQQRANRLLDILDRAEVEGRAAQMLESVADMRPGGARMPSVGQMVRLVARIESGEITAPEMGVAMQVLAALERNVAPGAAGVATPAGSRVGRDVVLDTLTQPLETLPETEEDSRPFNPIRRPPTAPQLPVSGAEDEQPFNPFRRPRAAL